MAEHSNGTRITVSPLPSAKTKSSSLPEIMVECPGFARVTHNAGNTRQTLVNFPDGSVVVGSPDGSYSVEREAQYKLEVDSTGVSHCILQPGEPAAYRFCIDHTGSGGNILQASREKSKRASFSVSCDGDPSVLSRSENIPPHPAFSPRYFVVPTSGRPYQILNKSELDLLVSAAESESDTTVMKGEPVPGFKGTTVVITKTLREENPAIMPYKNGAIVPRNLSLAPAGERRENPRTNGSKRFGVGVGKSLHIISSAPSEVKKQVETPKAVECRQFVVLDQFDSASHDKVLDGLAKYISWRESQSQAEDRLLPVDTRTSSEITAAHNLKSEWLAKMTGNILSLALQGVQQHHQPSIGENSTPVPGGDTGGAKDGGVGKSTRLLDGVRRDLEQAEHDRTALRNYTVPGYFDSDGGRQFLRSQSPDMESLSKQLAQTKTSHLPPHPLTDLSQSSTPSSLLSASIVLQQPDCEADSPDVGGDVDSASVSPMSRIRPAHPTPDHARGLRSPTDVRPKNPTPFRADRLGQSPAPSLLSQPDPPETASLRIGGGATDDGGHTHSNEADTAAVVGERSVSFMLPPQRLSLIERESCPDGQPKRDQGESDTQTQPLHTSKVSIYLRKLYNQAM